MINYKIFSLILSLFVALMMIILARRSKVRFSQFLWWFSAICSILVFGFFPTLIDFLGKLAGVSYPPTLISILGLGLLLIKVFSMDIYITKNEIRYRKIAQKIALLEKSIRDHNNRMKTNNQHLNIP